MELGGRMKESSVTRKIILWKLKKSREENLDILMDRHSVAPVIKVAQTPTQMKKMFIDIKQM